MTTRVRDVCQRVAAAVIGGYALTVAFSVLLSFTLPVPRAEGVLTGLLISFLVYTAAVIWAFAVRSIRRMWWGLLGPTAAFAVLALLLWRAGAGW